jgi:phospholipase D3/4
LAFGILAGAILISFTPTSRRQGPCSRLGHVAQTRAMPSSPHRRRLLLLPLLVAAAALWGAPAADAGADTCKAWLVQSIPTDMPHLRRVPGVLSTGMRYIPPLSLVSASPHLRVFVVRRRAYAGMVRLWGFASLGIRCRRRIC